MSRPRHCRPVSTRPYWDNIGHVLIKHAAQQGGGSIWYRIQVRTSGYLTVDTFGSSIDTLIGMYKGTAVDALTEIINNDDFSATVKQSRITRFAIQPGETYMLAVDGKNRARGNIRLNINLEAGPLYDNYADAKPVNSNSWSDTRSNATYSSQSGEPSRRCGCCIEIGLVLMDTPSFRNGHCKYSQFRFRYSPCCLLGKHPEQLAVGDLE
jgi:hypothetical protein